MKIDLISLLSTGSGSDFINKTGSGAGHSSISREDVAMALASATHPLGALLLRCKYLQTDKAEMYQRFADLVRQECLTNKWFVKSKNEDLYERMAYAVIDESLYSRCKHCNGTKLKRRQSPAGGYIMVDCEACNSTGYATPNLAERAKKMGISYSGYYVKWNDRFDYFASILNDIEQKTIREFSKKLSH